MSDYDDVDEYEPWRDFKKRELWNQLQQHERNAISASNRVRYLQRQVEDMQKNWRPVPIAHPWTPKNPQCALCDEPKDSPRHEVQP